MMAKLHFLTINGLFQLELPATKQALKMRFNRHFVSGHFWGRFRP